MLNEPQNTDEKRISLKDVYAALDADDIPLCIERLKKLRAQQTAHILYPRLEVDSKGRVTIPQKIRDKYFVATATLLEFKDVSKNERSRFVLRLFKEQRETKVTVVKVDEMGRVVIPYKARQNSTIAEASVFELQDLSENGDLCLLLTKLGSAS
ncbi:Transcriptional regulator MraZ [uncultured archaeon]|nr:Transcriptional regulator MraZ [uncultured archaeon]